MRIINFKKVSFALLIVILAFIFNTKNINAQDNQSVLYVPLIGITSVPKPLALPMGAGNVTYYYAVKNFLSEVPLTNITVVDNKCGPVVFNEGDDNGNSKLDFNETWRFSCTTQLLETSQSIATVTGSANNIIATHKAYTTVIVGSDNPAPLVSVINITKVAYPLSLPAEGGKITFTYKVNNPGIVPLSKVVVSDNKCNILSGRLGDTNGNNLLDTNEVWIYTCTTILKKTTTNTVNVTANANGLEAMDNSTITVVVDSPALPDTGNPIVPKLIIWGVLTIIIIVLFTINNNRFKKPDNRSKAFRKWSGK